MAEPDYSKSWYQRSGGNLPFNESLAAHVRKELGPNAEHRYEAYDDAISKMRAEYYDKYGKNWPRPALDKFIADNRGLRSTLIRPHEEKLFDMISELEEYDPMDDEPENVAKIERDLRQQYPDLVSRMERGQVQPVQEPRAPVMQPKPPVMPPVRKAEAVPPAPKAPMQKPAQVTPPRQRPMTETEKGLSRFQQQMAEQFKDIKPPTQQDLAKERLRNMMYERERELRARPVVPVSLPEAVNPTGE